MVSSRIRRASSCIRLIALASITSTTVKPVVYSETKRLDTEEESYREAMRQLRVRRDELYNKWDYENKNSRLPTITWPDFFPEEEEIPHTRLQLAECSAKSNTFKARCSAGWLRKCAALQFQLATALITIQSSVVSTAEGGAFMKDLSDLDHPDGLVGYALCLIEEKGGWVEDLHKATELLQRAVNLYNHPHALYELGVLYYQGIGVEEDEGKALQLFRKAAEADHCGSMYMLGDCLLEGIGGTRDRKEALEWLLIAGEKGHRGARSRLLALLDDDGRTDHGKYTDASRQSYKRRKTKLERRMTVQESRK